MSPSFSVTEKFSTPRLLFPSLLPSVLLYGKPKTGITSLAKKFPKPLILNLNDDLSQHKIEKQKITNWVSFLKVSSDIKKKKYEIKTIVISHIEKLWEEVCNYVVYKHNKDNNSNVKNIAEVDYSEYKTSLYLFESKLKKLISLGYNVVVLLSHEYPVIRNINGIEKTYFQANLERKFRPIVTGFVDVVGHLYADDEGNRILTFKPCSNQITGSRYKELLRKYFIVENGKPEFIKTLEKKTKTTSPRKPQTKTEQDSIN